MKEKLLDSIHCPACGEKELELEKINENTAEIREGYLKCSQCSARYAISKGMVYLYKELSQAAEDERVALAKEIKEEKLLEYQNAQWLLNFPNNSRLGVDVRTDRIIKLISENTLLFLKSFTESGLKILELGAGNCWLTAHLSRDNDCVALDIFDQHPKGLESADIFIKNWNIYFERVVADMIKLPFNDKAFDVVIISSALHHSTDLVSSLLEIKRVLTSQGRLILMNEPSRGWLGSKERKTDIIDKEHGFSEQRYFIKDWKQALVKAGFSPRIFLPYNFVNVLKTRGRLFQLMGAGMEKFPTGLQKAFISFLGLFVLKIYDGFFCAICANNE